MTTRRNFLQSLGQGFGSIALAAMLAKESRSADKGSLENPGAGGVLHTFHHPPRATRVIQLFMAGAASAIDLFDFKPELVKHHGEMSDFGEPVEAFQNGLGPWLKPI